MKQRAPFCPQLPKTVVHYAATVLFFFFGARLLYEGVLNKTEVCDCICTSSSLACAAYVPPRARVYQAISEEIAEVEREIAEKEGTTQQSSGEDDNRKIRRSISAKVVSMSMCSRKVAHYFLPGRPVASSRVCGSVHGHVFGRVGRPFTNCHHWYDSDLCVKSVLQHCSFTGLAIDYDILSVTLGGVLGHAICTGAAVLGGRHLASHIDERVVSVVGGLLFLGFGIHALVEGV